MNAWLQSLEADSLNFVILSITPITDSPTRSRVLVNYGWFVP
jgi:hypothetical protein